MTVLTVLVSADAKRTEARFIAFCPFLPHVRALSVDLCTCGFPLLHPYASHRACALIRLEPFSPVTGSLLPCIRSRKPSAWRSQTQSRCRGKHIGKENA